MLHILDIIGCLGIRVRFMGLPRRASRKMWLQRMVKVMRLVAGLHEVTVYPPTREPVEAPYQTVETLKRSSDK